MLHECFSYIGQNSLYNSSFAPQLDFLDAMVNIDPLFGWGSLVVF